MSWLDPNAPLICCSPPLASTESLHAFFGFVCIVHNVHTASHAEISEISPTWTWDLCPPHPSLSDFLSELSCLQWLKL